MNRLCMWDSENRGIIHENNLSKPIKRHRLRGVLEDKHAIFPWISLNYGLHDSPQRIILYYVVEINILRSISIFLFHLKHARLTIEYVNWSQSINFLENLGLNMIFKTHQDYTIWPKTTKTNNSEQTLDLFILI